MKKVFFLLLAITLASSSFAQPLIDKIVGQVGDKIILMSEIESFYYEELQKGDVADDYRCRIMQELIVISKIFLVLKKKWKNFMVNRCRK